MQENGCLERLYRYLQRELDFWDFSGVIRVLQGGRPLLTLCRGEANREHGVKNTPSTRFALASLTKQFTAFSILLLNDRGLLELEADANRYLPADMQLPAGITIHHLLCHCSGLYNSYNFTDGFYIGADRLPFDKKAFFRDWVARPPVAAPGERFEYNNANYNLLAWILENVSGRPYAQFLQQELFLPLGMEGAFLDDGQTVILGRADTYMHDYGRTVRTPYCNPLFHTGAGGLVADCASLERWYCCLRDRQLLSAQAYERFFTENRSHYCYGLKRHAKHGRVSYAHGGDMNGVATYVQCFFSEDLCILILSNNESLNQYRLGDAAAEILHGGDAPYSERPAEFPVSPGQLRRYTGTYLPGKVWLEEREGKLYLVRVNQNIHIELYCTAPGTFWRRWEEAAAPHVLCTPGEGPSVWGFRRVSEDWI